MKTAKKAKTARKKTAKKKGAVKKAGAATKKSPGKPKAKRAKAGLGCCTIVFDDKADEQIENVSKSECTKRARAMGGTGQWNPGSCA